jgi:hypothetical protein
MDDPPVFLSKTRFHFLAASPLQVTSSAAVLMMRLPFMVLLQHQYNVLIDCFCSHTFGFRCQVSGVSKQMTEGRNQIGCPLLQSLSSVFCCLASVL